MTKVNEIGIDLLLSIVKWVYVEDVIALAQVGPFIEVLSNDSKEHL